MARSLADLVRSALEQIEEITPDEAMRIHGAEDRDGWHFVDVRESDEYQAGRIPGSRLVPRGFLEVKADLEHPKRDAWLEDRSRALILYCGGGHRSALAVATLREMGFTRVVSMAEGFAGWSKRDYPVES
jgi:rhodanese-related sulfurtransferase